MTSDELLQRFFADRAALEAYVFSATRDYHATQDILQNAAVVVVRKAATYDAAKPFAAWASGIVRLELNSWLRSRREPVMTLDPATLDACAPAFERVFTRREQRRAAALSECLKTLSDSGRRLLSLRYAARQTCEQIASELERSVQAVYAMLKRLKAALRDCVAAKLKEAAR